MEYGYLIIQLSFLVLTILSTFDRYLVNSDMYYKKTKIMEMIAQGFCIVTNITALFLMKELMVYILVMHIILMGAILIFYSNKAKKKYFEELLNLIIINDLQSVDPKEIRIMLLEKYSKVYFIQDIEKCLKLKREQRSV